MAAGAIRNDRRRRDESIFQPEWSPDGARLVFVSDRTGWWNLYRFDLATRAMRAAGADGGGVRRAAMGVRHVDLCVRRRRPDRLRLFAGGARPARACSISRRGTLTPLDMPFTEFGSVRADGDRVVFRAGAPDRPASIVALDLGVRPAHRAEARRPTFSIAPTCSIADYLTSGREPSNSRPPAGRPPSASSIRRTIPTMPAPAGEQPPLLVKCHGGPTSAASSTLNLGIQYLDQPRHRGARRELRRQHRLRPRLSRPAARHWGVVDVDDCVNGARFLAERGRVDGKRCVISGGSAGGYTTLAALTFRDVFQGGASHYGVSDLAALARDTHKFESRYLDWLIGPYPQEEARYRERSPLYHADRLSKPVIFFQGDEDAVVPPNQTETMVEALRRKGNPVGYFLFAGEQHGFRKADNIQRCLDAELAFYAIEVFRTGLTF